MHRHRTVPFFNVDFQKPFDAFSVSTHTTYSSPRLHALAIFLRLVSCNHHRVLGLVLDSEEHLCLRPLANTKRQILRRRLVACRSPHSGIRDIEWELAEHQCCSSSLYQSRSRTKPSSFKPFDPQNVGADHGMGEWETRSSWSVS
jgi:hypothetical protein